MRLLALLYALFLSCQLSAHTVEVVFFEFEEIEKEWLIGGSLDLAYVLPETRGVEDQGPLSRYELLEGTAEEHARYAREAEAFFRDKVTLTYGGEPLDYEIRILDPLVDGIYQFQEDPEDLAFIQVQAVVPRPEPGKSLVIGWNDDLEADMQLSMARDEKWQFFPVDNGTQFEIIAGDGESPGEFWPWLKSGFRHVLPLGLDHAAFMIALFCLVGGLRKALMLSLIFTIAHGTTLALLVLGVVQFGSWVELAIGLTIAWAGWEVWRGAKVRPWTVAVIFAFGLLHGLGFGSVLQEQVAEAGTQKLLWPLVGFNLGVELAQISLICLCAVALRLFGKGWLRWAGLAVLIYGSYLGIERAFF